MSMDKFQLNDDVTGEGIYSIKLTNDARQSLEKKTEKIYKKLISYNGTQLICEK